MLNTLDILDKIEDIQNEINELKEMLLNQETNNIEIKSCTPSEIIPSEGYLLVTHNQTIYNDRGHEFVGAESWDPITSKIFKTKEDAINFLADNRNYLDMYSRIYLQDVKHPGIHKRFKKGLFTFK